MKRFLVKVCGITRAQDGRTAVSAGADLVGLNFSRLSPRYVTKRQALEIIKELPVTARLTGVFVDESVERIVEMARLCRLEFVQLHGSEKGSDIRFLQRTGLKVIKAFGICSGSDWEKAAISRADIILADNRTKDVVGGTGRTFNWKLRPSVKIANLMLAGGISVDNVEEAIKKFDPMVIDVNSGVESSPGVKSARKVKEFLKLCNRLRYDC